MTTVEWRYSRPDSVEEAVTAFQAELDGGGAPFWYGGGTEVITDHRMGRIAPTLLVDISRLPETRVLAQRDAVLWLGASVTLDELTRRNPWPLLSEAAGRVADHTTRTQITLGGHIAGRIGYREASLPFLLWDESLAEIWDVAGPHIVPLSQVFDGVPRWPRGTLITAIGVPEGITTQPGRVVKATRLDWVDYPLVTVALAQDAQGRWRLALSGLRDAPWRAESLEPWLNSPASPAERAAAVVAHLPADVTDDVHGTPAYRRFVLGLTLEDMLMELDG